MKKIAVVISGYLRGFEHNIESIQQHVINCHGHICDIYIHITEEEHNDKYINKKKSIDFIKDKLNPKLIVISKNLLFTQDSRVNNLLNQNYKLYLLNENRKQIMTIENIHYDTVIKIRPDIYLHQDLNLDTSSNIIYIPTDSKIDKQKLKHIDDKYICDIIAYGDNDVMNRYFDFYKSIYEFIEKHGVVNETILYHYLTKNDIQYKLIEIDYIVILSLCNTIAITGDSGTGKTKISTLIKQLFDNSFILECDRYHKWERGDKNWEKFTHLNPDANCIAKMTNDVFDLKLGKNIYQIDYDHETGRFTDKSCIESKDNIIVCGLHSLYLPQTIVNLKIYMDTDENLRIPWKIKRDITKRGYTIDKIISQIKDRSDDFEKYIYPQKNTADIIIRFYTETIFDINNFDINAILKVYLKIGFKHEFNVMKIYDSKFVSFIDNHDNNTYLYFKEQPDYDDIIKHIINLYIENI